jgi:hypothetical protein
MHRYVVGIAMAALLASSGTAAAQPQEEAPRDWSVTLSPVHLLIGPIVEVTAERRVGDRLGFAVMVGAGRFTNESSTGVENTFSVFEGGISVRGYVLGDFDHGLQLGAAAEYLQLSGEDINDSGVGGVGSGLVLAPFVGYKHVWSFGLTFDGQLGPSYLAVRAEDDTGSTAEDSDIGVYLNLNLGWSF